MTTRPGFVRHVGVGMERPAQGRSRLTLEVAAHHLNGNGVAHGGVLFTLADTAMGAALFSTLAADEACATIECKIAFFKPVFEGLVVCTGEILHRGKSVASTEASLWLGEQLVGKATGSFAIFKRKQPPPTQPAASG